MDETTKIKKHITTSLIGLLICLIGFFLIMLGGFFIFDEQANKTSIQEIQDAVEEIGDEEVAETTQEQPAAMEDASMDEQEEPIVLTQEEGVLWVDKKENMYVIDFGRLAGVQEGMIFEVYKGEAMKGLLRITHVDDYFSTGMPEPDAQLGSGEYFTVKVHHK